MSKGIYIKYKYIIFLELLKSIIYTRFEILNAIRNFNESEEGRSLNKKMQEILRIHIKIEATNTKRFRRSKENFDKLLKTRDDKVPMKTMS